MRRSGAHFCVLPLFSDEENRRENTRIRRGREKKVDGWNLFFLLMGATVHLCLSLSLLSFIASLSLPYFSSPVWPRAKSISLVLFSWQQHQENGKISSHPRLFSPYISRGTRYCTRITENGKRIILHSAFAILCRGNWAKIR